MTDMIKLANGREVTLDEFLTWSVFKQIGNIKPSHTKKHTAEARAKISANRRGGMSNRKHSVETRAKMSATREKAVMTPNGLFPSRRAVAQAAGVSASNITHWMKKWPEHYYYV